MKSIISNKEVYRVIGWGIIVPSRGGNWLISAFFQLTLPNVRIGQRSAIECPCCVKKYKKIEHEFSSVRNINGERHRRATTSRRAPKANS